MIYNTFRSSPPSTPSWTSAAEAHGYGTTGDQRNSLLVNLGLPRRVDTRRPFHTHPEACGSRGNVSGDIKGVFYMHLKLREVTSKLENHQDPLPHIEQNSHQSQHQLQSPP